ncbi:MAG TPA: SIMPL domain-containing protein, partial [bacterium]|nr:SIMPL domain-containing protein [bacterium]
EAMNDAKARAEKIAQSSGQGVGSLRSASMGVVQVLEPNSTEVSDYGSYDTSTIEKEVMVTVRATFLLK